MEGQAASRPREWRRPHRPAGTGESRVTLGVSVLLGSWRGEAVRVTRSVVGVGLRKVVFGESELRSGGGEGGGRGGGPEVDSLGGYQTGLQAGPHRPTRADRAASEPRG